MRERRGTRERTWTVERSLRRKRAMACEAGAVQDDEATTRGASGRVNRVTGSQVTEPLGDQGGRSWMVMHEGERSQPQGVKAPRGRSASMGWEEPLGTQRQAARRSGGDELKLDEPQDRLPCTNQRPPG